MELITAALIAGPAGYFTSRRKGSVLRERRRGSAEAIR